MSDLVPQASELVPGKFTVNNGGNGVFAVPQENVACPCGYFRLRQYSMSNYTLERMEKVGLEGTKFSGVGSYWRSSISSMRFKAGLLPVGDYRASFLISDNLIVVEVDVNSRQPGRLHQKRPKITPYTQPAPEPKVLPEDPRPVVLVPDVPLLRSLIADIKAVEAGSNYRLTRNVAGAWVWRMETVSFTEIE